MLGETMDINGGLTEGRIVHYVAYNGRHLAAIVTGMNPDKPGQVNLAVFTDMRNVNGDLSGGLQFHFHVPHAEQVTGSEEGAPHHPGTWHWPERA